MKIRILLLAAGVEVVTALLLIISPSIATRLLFGAELSPAGLALAPLTAIALLALAIACWPTRSAPRGSLPALLAMLLFSAAAALYLVNRGLTGAGAGILLWPASVLHGVLAILLAVALLLPRGKADTTQPQSGTKASSPGTTP
jgi:hypothetical protein